MSSIDVEFYANMIRMDAEQKKISDEASIIELVNKFQTIIGYTDEEAVIIRKKVLEKMQLHMDIGIMLKYAEHKMWYLSRTKDSKMEYTERNLDYLSFERRMTGKVISTLDNVTNEIMEGMGDPQSGNFKRRGLVIGDVQSGKTNTYTTLCCKAADVGYKIIILLTGTLENLRRQTQKRLDEGFVGRDSDHLLKKEDVDKYVGVGKINPHPSIQTFTSTERDFNINTMIAAGFSIKNSTVPVLLVVKKNKNILDNLYRWLKENNAEGGMIDETLLMLDDEADSASINTGQEDITRINGLLRDILKLFTKTTYVGFTATPFANIFIDPESTDEMKGDDLFPRDFIYSLNPPSNYIGSTKLFGKNVEYAHLVKTIDDASKIIPEPHKKTHVIKELPPSLIEAINCFIISCTIRDLRGENNKSMSMLVNASRFTDVQENLKFMINERFDATVRSIKAYSSLDEKDALSDSYIFGLKETWEREYANTEFSWPTIQKEFEHSSKIIQIRSINQKNGAKNLNYSDYPNGLRLIAIGGNSLSRGLTLEGLCISYFYRKSQTYDTLMQMGRWFGYRDGYSDLCRIWMTRTSTEWYKYITDATEELKYEIEIMQNQNRTPEEFGLLVRNDIAGLYITDRKKMSTASDKIIVKSVNGRLIDTHDVYFDSYNVLENNRIMAEFFSKIEKHGINVWKNENTKNWVWRQVPKKYISELVSEYHNPSKNVIFDSASILRLLSEEKSELELWDVAIPHGNGAETTIAGVSFKCPQRAKYTRKSDTTIQMPRRQLTTPGHTKEGLYDENGKHDEALVEKLEDQFRKAKGTDSSFPSKTYLNTDKRRPLLLIYVLDITPEETKEEYEDIRKLGDIHPIGLAIGFPKFNIDGDSDRYLIKYKANAIYEKFGNLDFDEEELN